MAKAGLLVMLVFVALFMAANLSAGGGYLGGAIEWPLAFLKRVVTWNSNSNKGIVTV